MKQSYPAILALAVILLTSGCTTTPSPAIPDPQEDHWSIEADRENGSAAVLHRGDRKARVEEELGRPKRRSRPDKKDPTMEVLYYERKVPGPLVQKTHSDSAGTMTVRQQMVYIYKFTLTFRSDVLESVKKERTMEEDNYGIPKFH